METKPCLYCKEVFPPNKYAPRQKVCSRPECQKRRQLESMRVWREKNPSYFKYDESKGLAWLETQRKRSRIWRQKNPEKVRLYRQTHSTQYRQYMRDYMRRYRELKKGKNAPADPQSP
ncbi:MAG: hypothetical protein HYZ52_05145 [Candidatus Omnitrophica bacterium]|nr:hypothetical protein [Candidatus Omnitrophota bacterium]